MIELHPVASLFRLMTDEEFEAFKADIAANSLREPIWLHPDGRIIDGRNRYRACCDLGLVPEYKTWDGNGSLVSLVVSLNLQRRHLSSSQRAMIALDVLPMMEEEARARMLAGAIATNTGRQRIAYPEGAQGKAAEHAATMVRSNRQYVADAKKIKEVRRFQYLVEYPFDFFDVRKMSVGVVAREFGLSPEPGWYAGRRQPGSASKIRDYQPAGSAVRSRTFGKFAQGHLDRDEVR